MTTTWKVQSTSRKSGKVTTLDPKFLSREAALSYVDNLERKAGQWYHYAAVSDAPQDAEGDAAWRELGIDPAVIAAQKARQSRQVDAGRTQAPSEDREALQAPWEPSEAEIERNRREVAAIERREWARFENRDLTAKATPQDTDEVTAEGTCRRCSGTGAFITYVENGVPKGPGGKCFRCEGKGVQTLGDVKRNGYRDRHQRVSI